MRHLVMRRKVERRCFTGQSSFTDICSLDHNRSIRHDAQRVAAVDPVVLDVTVFLGHVPSTRIGISIVHVFTPKRVRTDARQQIALDIFIPKHEDLLLFTTLAPGVARPRRRVPIRLPKARLLPVLPGPAVGAPGAAGALIRAVPDPLLVVALGARQLLPDLLDLGRVLSYERVAAPCRGGRALRIGVLVRHGADLGLFPMGRYATIASTGRELALQQVGVEEVAANHRDLCGIKGQRVLQLGVSLPCDEVLLAPVGRVYLSEIVSEFGPLR